MPGKKKDPNKTYSPTWGGPGREGGRKLALYPLHLIKIACTEEELAQILKAISDTRRRTTILLEAARAEGKTDDTKESG